VKFRRGRRVEAGIDLTPLIDVVFLMVIFLTVSTSFIRQGQLRINLPEADARPVEEKKRRLELVISAEGEYAVDGKALVDAKAQTISAALRDVSPGDTGLPLVITADAQTPHEFVVRAMDVAGRLGFSTLGIATRQPPSKDAAANLQE
jgi:biopolymer transport protein ExbD